MKYHTDNYLNRYLRLLQPPYDGVLGEIQQEATEQDIPIVPHEVARF